MFVRFQYRIPKRTAARRALDAAAAAIAAEPGAKWKLRRQKQAALVVLVAEAHWTDGKPRQRLVHYLGTITQAGVHRIDARHKFWTRVDRRLAEFTTGDKERFVIAIEALVARPTAEEVAALLKPTEAMLRRAAAIEAARVRMATFKAERSNTNQEIDHKEKPAPAFH